MSNDGPREESMFTVAGKNLAFTFALVSSLFLIWGFCNGMIDTMDKHFQDQLGLTKAQSAWVQFAHYMGYALMALPAGLLTRRIGYKGGIVFGLVLVAVGGFWFMPATRISEFWAFLMGVCLIAMGLTVLETVANPYTTVLGPKQYGTSRINLAQSCNSVGWILGPIAGGLFFYSVGGSEKAQEQLYIPYLGIAIGVLVLAAMFFFAPVPDIKVEDEYHTDEGGAAVPVAKERNRALILVMMFLNVAILGLSVYMVLHTILPGLDLVSEATIDHRYSRVIIGLVILTLPLLIPFAKKVTTHSIWAHPHFSGATLAQFFYVAAQAGIFSFFINSMTVDKSNGYTMVPALPDSWRSSVLKDRNWIEVRTAFSPEEIKDYPALATWLKTKPDPVAEFVSSQLSRPTAKTHVAESPSGDPAAPVAAAPKDSESPSAAVTGAPAPLTRSSDDTISMLADYQEGGPVDEPLQQALLHDLNRIIRQEIGNKEGKKDNKPVLFDPERYSTVRFSQKTLDQAAATKETKSDHAILRLNRLMLQDALPDVLPYHDSILAISDQGASFLSSIAFGCFLLGRISGAWLLKRFSAHKTLGLYALLNVGVCFLIISQLGWVSVLCVFVSYFFMSIMFPTIFAVGIYGLGSQSKKKASAFIVMSITGGALMPKFMGYLGDVFNMSAAFWMPLGCFILIALYAFAWPKLSGHESLSGLQTTGGH
jgi:fucose permease